MKKLLSTLAILALVSSSAFAENVTAPTPSAVGIAAVGQIPGTATNDSASAGNVGEFVELVVTNASPVTITTSGTSQNLASISLTAGDWDVSGVLTANPGTAVTALSVGLNTTTGTLPAIERETQMTGTFPGRVSATVPRQRVSLTTTTTMFLVGNVTFTGATTMYGFLNARRAR